MSSCSGVMKTCSTCKAEKLISDFYKKGDRIESACKLCKKKWKRDSYQKKEARIENERFVGVLNEVVRFMSKRQLQTLNDLDQFINSVKKREVA